MHSNIQEYLNHYIAGVRMPLLIHGDAICEWDPEEICLIRVDCTELMTWPGVAWRIVQELNKFENQPFPVTLLDSFHFDDWMEACNQLDPGSGSRDLFFPDYLEQLNFRREFLNWISDLMVWKKICILINELDRLGDEETTLLSWLPSELPKNLWLICTTKSTEMVQNGGFLGWFTAELDVTDSLSVPRYSTALDQFRQISIGPDNFFKQHDLRIWARIALSNALESGDLRTLQELMTDPQVLSVLAPLDWPMIRAGWMHLLLHTDLPLPEIHLDLLHRLKEDDTYLLLERMATLSKDLQFRRCQNELIHVTGKIFCESSLEPDLTVYPSAFLSDYALFRQKHRRNEYRLLHKEIDQYLQDNDLPPSQLCLILYLKTDCAQRIHAASFKADANNYYLAALCSGDIMEVHRSLPYLADALYQNGYTEEALKVYQRIATLSVRIGHLYGLLFAKDSIAMCLKKLDRYTEAAHIYHDLRRIFLRLEDPNQTPRKWMDYCEALYTSGNPEKAAEEAESLLLTITDSAPLAIQKLKITVIGRLGKYYRALKRYDRAQELLEQTLQNTWRIGERKDAIDHLIGLYTETDRYMSAVWTYRREAEVFWHRKEFGELAKFINEAIAYMRSHHLPALADHFQNFWVEQLVSLNDLSYCKAVTDQLESDLMLIKHLEPQLQNAVERKDWLRAAELSHKIAMLRFPSDRVGAASNFLDAAVYHNQYGNHNASKLMLEESLSCVFKSGRILDQVLYNKLISTQNAEELQYLSLFWIECGKHLPMNGRIPEPTESSAKALRSNLSDILKFGTCLPYATASALCDLAPLLIAVFTAGELQGIMEHMEQNNAQMLALVLCDHIAENWTRDMTGLFRCANAVEKARITAYYANGAELMHLRNHWRTGPICADLALLFRDQKDPKSAIAFHEYAMESFSGPDHRRDIMAQYEEFVETYRYFGMNQEAVALLQRAVQDALSWEMKRDVALFSGKLAHLMIQCKTGNQKDIDLLFDLQVRTLEEGNYVQELALALLEQAEYYSFKPFREEVFLAKVERAAALSSHFNDQAQIERLNRLERIIQLSRKKIAERLFYKLLRSVPEFEIRDARRTGKSGYHFICMHRFHSDSLHVVIQIGEAGQVDSVGFIAECPLPGGTVTEDMEHYARAWNKRKIYALNLINDVSLVQAVYSPDWTATDELCDLLVQFIKLWNLDQNFISFIANGEMSAEECIRKKMDIQEGTT